MVEADLATILVFGRQFLGDNGITATHTGKAGGLRETAEFHGAFTRSLYLIYRMGHILFADE